MVDVNSLSGVVTGVLFLSTFELLSELNVDGNLVLVWLIIDTVELYDFSFDWNLLMSNEVLGAGLDIEDLHTVLGSFLHHKLVHSGNIVSLRMHVKL